MKGVAASPLPFLPLLFPLLPICHFFIGDADNTLTFLSNLLLRFLSSFPSFLLHLQRMAGPPLLPFRDTSERMEKRTGQHQLLLASCGTCMRMWMPVATDVDPPSLATTTASASAQYHTVLQKKTPLCRSGQLYPRMDIFSLYSISSLFTKKKKVVTSFFRHRCGAQGSITPSLSSWGSFSVGQGDAGPLLPNLGFFLRPARGHAGNSQPKEREAHDAHAHTLGTTNDSNKQMNNFTPRASSNEIECGIYNE